MAAASASKVHRALRIECAAGSTQLLGFTNNYRWSMQHLEQQKRERTT
jgi:hypothetical protein